MAKKWISRLTGKARVFWEYASHGVWCDSRPKLYVNLIKTLNIAVRSFFSADVQTQACAMTYRTLLSIVPAFAMIVAIGRGFGVQDLIERQIYDRMPGQQSLVEHLMAFVDKYLNTTSNGLFIGIGMVFLLYALISLMQSMENTFNLIWNVRERRSLWRQITDYTAMLLILPVLLVLGAGVSIFLSETIQGMFDIPFMTPIISCLFEVGSFVFTCLFFTALFMLIPNTKVRFQNALIAGFITGIGFTVLQWLFISGQLWVSRSNAVYGGFSFLPLFLLWMQMVWVIILSGSLICYASQNIFQYSFSDQISTISRSYRDKVTVAIAAVVVQRFVDKQPPVKQYEIIEKYGIPSRLVANVLDLLIDAGIVSRVVLDNKGEVLGYQPAVDPAVLTVGYLRDHILHLGASGFIPHFNKNFPGVVRVIDSISDGIMRQADQISLADIDIAHLPAEGVKSQVNP